MKLMLDHGQRLNLHAFLGAQRADVGSIRALGALQDRLALDTDEENAIELKHELVSGQEHIARNPLTRATTGEMLAIRSYTTEVPRVQ